MTGLMTFLQVGFGFLLVFSPVFGALLLDWFIGDSNDD